jgi:hypothetical protein
MAYKSRSKYTPGGGVLAFFEQVSRFVSLSVLGWVATSLFFILFLADGKITDSFDLRLLKGVFSDVHLTWTALVLVAMSGIVGGLLSLPSAVVLFLTRQYLDFHSARSSRKSGLIRVKIVRSLPVTILVLCHLTAVLFGLVSAPQLTRNWFESGSRFSSSLTGIHFVLSSLSRKSFGTEGSESLLSQGKRAEDTTAANRNSKHVQIFFVPADVLESEEFQSEQSKLKDAQKIKFIMTKSNLSEQIDDLFSEGTGQTSRLVKKIVRSPRHYGRVQRDKDFSALLSISPQLRFGRAPYGRGTDSVAQMTEEILVYESQRRLVASQVQLFGVFRLFEGLPILGRQMDWLDLVSDDIARIRAVAKENSAHRAALKSLSIIQLSALERGFESVNVPFRSFGWPEKISQHEKRLIIKNTLRELSQYIQDVSSGVDVLWVVLPYADDKRISPASFAFVKPGVSLPNEFRPGTESHFGVMNVEMGRFLRGFLGESALTGPSELHSGQTISSKAKPETIRCFESEVDLESNDFLFQPAESRQRSLGQLLNFLPQLPKGDLEFLSRGTLHLVARDPGFGFVCKVENQAFETTYLIKPALSSEDAKFERRDPTNTSILVSSAHSGRDAQQVSSRQRNLNSSQVVSGSAKFENNVFKGEVLSGFRVFVFTQKNDDSSAAMLGLREFDKRESLEFFARFEPETLQAFEGFARARIR